MAKAWSLVVRDKLILLTWDKSSQESQCITVTVNYFEKNRFCIKKENKDTSEREREREKTA